MRSKIAATLIAFSLLTSQVPSAEAVPTVFKNCASLLKIYKFGISSSVKSSNTGAGPINPPKVSKALYSLNKKLDTDRDGIACEVVVKVAIVLPAITFENLDPLRTKEVAQTEIAAALSKSNSSSESVLVVRAGPSLTETDIQVPKKSVLSSISLFSNLVLPSAVNVNWFSGNDSAWIDQAIRDAGGNPNWTPTGAPYSSWLATVGVKNCNMGNATIGSKGPFLNQCLKSDAPASLAAETASHEYFHTVQAHVTTLNQPLWFVEGSATFVGIHVGGNSFGDFTGARFNTLRRYATGGMDSQLTLEIANGNKEYVFSRLKLLESTSVSQEFRASAYPLGMLLTEILVAVGGFDKWSKFLSEVKPVGFEGALRANYSISLDELYQKSAGYVISQLKK